MSEVDQIRQRLEDAVNQCMCAVCVLDEERRHPVDCLDCDGSREYHRREDVPYLLAQLAEAQAKLDCARGALKKLECVQSENNWVQTLVCRTIVNLGQPRPDTTKLGECAEPYHYYRADQKRGTCSCAALTEKAWDVCRCGARFHLKDSPSGVCPDCRDQTAKDSALTETTNKPCYARIENEMRKKCYSRSTEFCEFVGGKCAHCGKLVQTAKDDKV